MEEGWVNLHLLLWKFLIYHVVIVETEDAKFQVHETWQAAWQRLELKILAKQEAIRTDLLRADSRGLEPPDVTSRSKCMHPIAKVEQDGTITWDENIRSAIKQLATPPKKPQRRGGQQPVS